MSVVKITRIFLVVLLISSSSPISARAAELIAVRATYSAIGGAFAPLWLAQDKGLFNKYGLAVDLKYILSATGTQALLSTAWTSSTQQPKSLKPAWAARVSLSSSAF